jgi:hypothetical protein
VVEGDGNGSPSAVPLGEREKKVPEIVLTAEELEEIR